jgi:pyridinium-3,5-biscarboxylic acid mononucleotide synthase
MDERRLKKLLDDYKRNKIDFDQAVGELRKLPYENIDGFARLDHHRQLRRGVPEVIFGEGKKPEHLVRIFNQLVEQSDVVMATRVQEELFTLIRNDLPQDVRYDTNARIMSIDRRQSLSRYKGIIVLSAGTSDINVSEEAALTAELLGNEVTRIYDIGVAGLHRLLDQIVIFNEARVIVVVAGMEGALPSVVAGLVEVPVIAVPTSIGYGTSFQGLTALLAMLNSCATGISVVNIDNGFGAGYLASNINQLEIIRPINRQLDSRIK